jgi:hypothetical protein
MIKLSAIRLPPRVINNNNSNDKLRIEQWVRRKIIIVYYRQKCLKSEDACTN